MSRPNTEIPAKTVFGIRDKSAFHRLRPSKNFSAGAVRFFRSSQKSLLCRSEEEGCPSYPLVSRAASFPHLREYNRSLCRFRLSLFQLYNRRRQAEKRKPQAKKYSFLKASTTFFRRTYLQSRTMPSIFLPRFRVLRTTGTARPLRRIEKSIAKSIPPRPLRKARGESVRT